MKDRPKRTRRWAPAWSKHDTEWTASWSQNTPVHPPLRKTTKRDCRCEISREQPPRTRLLGQQCKFLLVRHLSALFDHVQKSKGLMIFFFPAAPDRTGLSEGPKVFSQMPWIRMSEEGQRRRHAKLTNTTSQSSRSRKLQSSRSRKDLARLVVVFASSTARSVLLLRCIQLLKRV